MNNAIKPINVLNIFKFNFEVISINNTRENRGVLHLLKYKSCICFSSLKFRIFEEITTVTKLNRYLTIKSFLF